MRAQTQLELPFGFIGASLLLAACAPKVSATIELTDPEPTARGPGDPVEGSVKRAGVYGPPAVIHAEFVSPTRIEIQFTEPLASLDGFDPMDFRLSIGRRYTSYSTSGYGHGYGYGYGYGPGYGPGYGSGQVAPSGGGSYVFAYYSDVGQQLHGGIQEITNIQLDGVQLELSLKLEVDLDFCHNLQYENQYQPGGSYASGLFLHYSRGRIPIADVDGTLMPSFGEAWVEAGREQPPRAQMDLNGPQAEAAMTGLVPISCGPPIPDGPR